MFCFWSLHWVHQHERKGKGLKPSLIFWKILIKETISEFDEMAGAGPTLDQLVDEFQSLERDLEKIVNLETAGLIVRSRINWVEHGEKSSRYFCNLEKRTSDRKLFAVSVWMMVHFKLTRMRFWKNCTPFMIFFIPLITRLVHMSLPVLF